MGDIAIIRRDGPDLHKYVYSTQVHLETHVEVFTEDILNASNTDILALEKQIQLLSDLRTKLIAVDVEAHTRITKLYEQKLELEEGEINDYRRVE